MKLNRVFCSKAHALFARVFSCEEGQLPKLNKIGIIGGSGLSDPDIIKNRKEKYLITPYGYPSDALIEGEINGVPCVILARHGRKHDISPSMVNYRANIWALRSSGCSHLIVSNACGSLREKIKRGDIIIPHSFIDRTTQRMQTFFDGEEHSPPGVCHLPMHPAFSERSRCLLIETAQELGYDIHTKGTVVCIEGPRYSSRAESLMYRIWGADLINMTVCPEAILAKEAGLLYAAVAVATDYDSWRETDEILQAHEVVNIFLKNVKKVKEIIVNTVQKIACEDWECDLLAARDLVCSNIVTLK